MELQLRAFLWGLLAVVCGLFVLFFLWADMRRIVSATSDDAAYFFQIARNIARGAGPTFDGIVRTNGFHPLWLLMLTVLYALVERNSEEMYRLGLVLQPLLLFASGVLLYRAHAKLFQTRVRVLSMVGFIFLVVVPCTNGMESAVLIFMLAVLFALWMWDRIFSAGRPMREFLFGAVIGLTVLARLDMVFLAGVVFVAGAVSLLVRGERRKDRFLRTVGMGAGFLVVISPYLMYNLLNFGSTMPISGALKSSFPHISLSGFPGMGKRYFLCVGYAVGYLVWAALGRGEFSRLSPRLRRFRLGMVVMAGAVLLHFLHTVLFMKWAVFNWHFIPYGLFACLAVSESVEHLLAKPIFARRGWLYWGCVVLLILIGGILVYRRHTRPLDRSWQVAAYDAALWARHHTPPTEIFAMKDAGNFGYFSERRVINLDGVVNNREYQKVLRDGRLNEYLAAKGVKFIVQHAFWEQEEVNSGKYEVLSLRFKSHLYGVMSDEIRVFRKDEVYRSSPYFDGPHRTVFIIWRWSDSSAVR